MTKELQDLAWNCLPKEFKEEVKKIYCTPGHRAEVYTLLQNLFGAGNLASDAEVEEMLTVSAITVREMYAANERIKNDASDNELGRTSDHVNHVLRCLFGSKCLPDNVDSPEPNVDSSHDNVDSSEVNVDSSEYLEPKANSDYTPIPEKTVVSKWDKTEPNSDGLNEDNFAKSELKFKIGDKVRFKYCCTPYHIDGFKMLDGAMMYQVGEVWAEESELEPYTDPGKEVVKMRLTTSKVSVYLATKEEDEEFRLLLHENGFRWISGDPLINNAYWNSYTEESKIYYFYPDKTVTYWGDKTSETLTFSEFKKQFFEEKPRKLSQETANCDYPVPDRLHIAAMAMRGLLSNADRMKMYEDVASYPPFDNLTRIVARNALRYADALIAEAHTPTQC